MALKMKIILFLTLLTLTLGCRFNPTPRIGLDMDRYYGRWYLIETGPLQANESGPINCVYESYEKTENPYVFDYNWHGETNGGDIILDDGIVTVTKPSESESTLNFFLDETVFHSKILATDYNTWSIEYTCHGGREGLIFERFMIRSRNPSLDRTVHQTLHNIINGFGTDVSEFAVVNHEMCRI